MELCPSGEFSDEVCAGQQLISRGGAREGPLLTRSLKHKCRRSIKFKLIWPAQGIVGGFSGRVAFDPSEILNEQTNGHR